MLPVACRSSPHTLLRTIHLCKGCWACALYFEPIQLVQGLLGVVALLAVPEYREAVLEGLVASIGGLDASLCNEASSALVAALHAPPSGGQPLYFDLVSKQP